MPRTSLIVCRVVGFDEDGITAQLTPVWFCDLYSVLDVSPDWTLYLGYSVLNFPLWPTVEDRHHTLAITSHPLRYAEPDRAVGLEFGLTELALREPVRHLLVGRLVIDDPHSALSLEAYGSRIYQVSYCSLLGIIKGGINYVSILPSGLLFRRLILVSSAPRRLRRGCCR